MPPDHFRVADSEIFFIPWRDLLIPDVYAAIGLAAARIDPGGGCNFVAAHATAMTGSNS
jgi:hypothetical protein